MLKSVCFSNIFLSLHLLLPYLLWNVLMELNTEFIARTKQLFGTDRFLCFETALNSAPLVSIRYNRLKSSDELCEDKVLWASDACYLEQRPMFTADPLFHAGCYYVQEAASMFLEQVVKQYISTPVRVLDLCAAPGGKSTHLLSLLPEGSLLVSNEPMPLRANVLAENIIKWGRPSAMVVKNEPKDFARFKNFFDVVVVDAPCSGEGMFRKDSFAVEQWSVGNVEVCAKRQREILSDVWQALRPGGLLVYSTCTFNREEDEDCVAWASQELGAQVLPLEVSPRWGITANLVGDGNPVYRFIPGYTRGEGFFLSVMRKDGDVALQTPRATRVQQVSAKQREQVSAWLTNPAEFDYIMHKDTIVAVPKRHADAINVLSSKLNVLHAALPVATVKNNKLLPVHALAMSTCLNRDAFVRVELEREKALQYLHREALLLPDAPVGILLLTYKGIPIGFAKNVGNRANNLYPTEWRIRKDPMEL